QLGTGQTADSALPAEVQGLPGPARAIAAGQFHSCAVTENDALYCWGLNADGQLGDGSRSNRPLATAISTLGSGVNKVALGARHSCALRSDGGVSCWGAAFFGLLLGDGSQQDRL